MSPTQESVDVSHVEEMIERAELRAEQLRIHGDLLSQHPSEQRIFQKELDATLTRLDGLRQLRDTLLAGREPGRMN
jgi:hypothetical protein